MGVILRELNIRHRNKPPKRFERTSTYISHGFDIGNCPLQFRIMFNPINLKFILYINWVFKNYNCNYVLSQQKFILNFHQEIFQFLKFLQFWDLFDQLVYTILMILNHQQHHSNVPQQTL